MPGREGEARQARGGLTEHDDGGERSPVAKALAVLEVVVRASAPVSAAAVGETLSLPRSTVHRLLQQLARAGYLERLAGARTFVAGPRLAAFAVEALGANGVRDARHVVLRALSDEVGEISALIALVGAEAIPVDEVEVGPAHGLRIMSPARLPLHCTASGKLLLAYLSRGRRERLVSLLPLTRYTPATITDREALREELARIRARGVALNDAEYEPGVVGVSVPVFGPRGRADLALTVTVPQPRLDIDAAVRFIPAMRRASERLTGLLTGLS